MYSNNTTGNSRFRFMYASGTAVASVSALIEGAVGNIAATNGDLSATEVVALTGRSGLSLKTGPNSVDTLYIDVDTIKSSRTLTVANRTKAAALVSGALGDSVEGKEYLLNIYDVTEGGEPSHIESVTVLGDGTAISALLATDHTTQASKQAAKGVGKETRFKVSNDAGKIKIETLDARTSFEANVQTVEDSTSSSLVKKALFSGASGGGFNEDELIDPSQWVAEGDQFGGGFNEIGFARKVDNIGTGSAIPPVGTKVLEIKYYDTDFSKSTPKTVASYEGTLYIAGSQAVLTKISAALGV